MLGLVSRLVEERAKRLVVSWLVGSRYTKGPMALCGCPISYLIRSSVKD